MTSITDLLAGAYLYTEGNILSIIGSTKTGSMQGFKHFYQPLSENKSIGESYKEWWHNFAQSSFSTAKRIRWYYGLCIIGDPFIRFKYNTSYSCINTIHITDYTPSYNNIIYYRAKEKIIISANFEQANGKIFIFDAPSVVFTDGFYLPNGNSIRILKDGCNCNH